MGSGRPGNQATRLRRLLAAALATFAAACPLAAPVRAQEEVETIERGLASGSEAARRLAVRRAARLDPEVARPLLERAAADPVTAVRVEALEGWFEIDAPGALAAWAPRIADEAPAVRRLFYDRAGRLGGREAVALLLAGLDDPSAAVRRAAAIALERSTGHRIEFDPDAGDEQRHEAARAWRTWLAAHRDLSPLERWRAEARDPDPSNRAAALAALATEGDDDVVPLILEGLADPVARVRTAAHAALRERFLIEPDPGFDPEIDPDRTAAAREAWWDWWLGHRGRTPRERLRQALEDADPLVRGRALARLAAGDDPGAIDLAIERLADPSSRVRERAAEALRRLTGLDQDFDPDGTPAEREAGVERWIAWREDAPRSKRAWLLDALRAPRARTRALAARALAEAGDPSVIPDLVDLLEDEAGGVRTRAIRAIESLAGERFEYDPDLPPEARKEAASEVRRSWRRRSDD